MFFYHEYTQNKELGFGGFILKTLVRLLPVYFYLQDFRTAISGAPDTALSGGNGCEIFLAVLIVICGLILSKPQIDPESLSATYRHRDIFAQILALLYSGGYLALLAYVIHSPE
jgi:hypothetical protein